MSTLTTVAGKPLIEGCILRMGRKAHRCSGNGASALGPCREYACTDRAIPIGTVHVEYIGDVPRFQSGSRHCLACAEAYFVDRSASVTS